VGNAYESLIIVKNR